MVDAQCVVFTPSEDFVVICAALSLSPAPQPVHLTRTVTRFARHRPRSREGAPRSGRPAAGWGRWALSPRVGGWCDGSHGTHDDPDDPRRVKWPRGSGRCRPSIGPLGGRHPCPPNAIERGPDPTTRLAVSGWLPAPPPSGTPSRTDLSDRLPPVPCVTRSCSSCSRSVRRCRRLNPEANPRSPHGSTNISTDCARSFGRSAPSTHPSWLQAWPGRSR